MSHPSSHSHDTPGHEKRDVVFRPIVLALLGMTLAIVLVFVLMRSTLVGLGGREARNSPQANPLAASIGRKAPPEPRLQTDPVRDLAVMREGEERLLHSYGWADKQRGIVRLPIERAMELLVSRCLPARATEASPR